MEDTHDDEGLGGPVMERSHQPAKRHQEGQSLDGSVGFLGARYVVEEFQRAGEDQAEEEIDRYAPEPERVAEARLAEWDRGRMQMQEEARAGATRFPCVRTGVSAHPPSLRLRTAPRAAPERRTTAPSTTTFS